MRTVKTKFAADETLRVADVTPGKTVQIYVDDRGGGYAGLFRVEDLIAALQPAPAEKSERERVVDALLDIVENSGDHYVRVQAAQVLKELI